MKFNMTRWKNENFGRRVRTLTSLAVIALHVTVASGCGDLFGALPCNDDSNCPPSLVCVDSLCAEPILCESGSDCESDEDCSDDGTCAQVECDRNPNCPTDLSVCADEECVGDETGCEATCATDLICDEVFDECLAGDVFEGDFVVESLAELEELRAFRRVTGTIFIGIENEDDRTTTDIEGFTDLNLELLVEAEGLWVWGQSSLVQVQMPALRVLGPMGFVISDSVAVTSITLPALTSAPLSIFRLESLVEIHLNRLQTLDVGSDFWVINLPVLEVLSAPELEAADEIVLQELGIQDGEPTTVAFPKLTRVTTMSVIDSPTLTEVTLPALTTVNGQIFFGSNFGATALSLPSLVDVPTLTVERNPVLSAVDVTSLARVDVLTVIFNDELCTDGLFDDVTVDGDVDVSSNGTCP